MNRRGFLGSILALGAAPAIVRADSLMRIVSARPLAIARVDHVRELIMYDLARDCHEVRYDALAKTESGGLMQWHAGARFSKIAEFPATREIARALLMQHLASEGIATKDLLTLPAPVGYRSPAWALAA